MFMCKIPLTKVENENIFPSRPSQIHGKEECK